MLQDEINAKMFHKLVREFFNTIREINKRIDELHWIIKNDFCTQNGKKEIVRRIKTLKETQFKCVFSLQDLISRITGADESNEEKREMELILKANNLTKELRNL